MKKVLLYIAIAILVLVLGGLLAVYRSVVCIQLPHGTVIKALVVWGFIGIVSYAIQKLYDHCRL